MRLSREKQKYIRSLHQKKYRQKYNKFLAEGDKIVEELLDQSRFRPELLVALPDWADPQLLAGRVDPHRLYLVDEPMLQQLSCLVSPNRVLAVVEAPVMDPPWGALQEDLLLYLDGIRDPGNLGTMLRIADWFGLPWVFCSPDSVEVYNPKVVQASMGAFLRVGVSAMPIREVVDHLPAMPVLGASTDGVDLYAADLPSSAILVVGNESRGLRAEALAALTGKVAIPRHRKGGAESLNAAVATGILCAQLRRGHMS